MDESIPLGEMEISDDCWQRAVLEREEEVTAALRRMETHTHSRTDWLLVVAFCGLSKQLVRVIDTPQRNIYPIIEREERE